MRYACLFCCLSLLALIVGSWLITSAWPDLAMRSLLSAAGVRWYFGTYTERVATPWLIYIVVGALAWGSAKSTTMWTALASYLKQGRSSLSTQQFFALLISLAFLLAQLAVIAYLTLPAHAVLLSVTGELWPSSFSRSIIPTMSFILISTHVAYAMLSGETRGLAPLLDRLSAARQWIMPVLLLYILAADLIGCLRYVLLMT